MSDLHECLKRQKERLIESTIQSTRFPRLQGKPFKLRDKTKVRKELIKAMSSSRPSQDRFFIRVKPLMQLVLDVDYKEGFPKKKRWQELCPVFDLPPNLPSPELESGKFGSIITKFFNDIEKAIGKYVGRYDEMWDKSGTGKDKTIDVKL